MKKSNTTQINVYAEWHGNGNFFKEIPHRRRCSKKAAHFCAAENLISGQITEALLPY